MDLLRISPKEVPLRTQMQKNHLHPKNKNKTSSLLLQLRLPRPLLQKLRLVPSQRRKVSLVLDLIRFSVLWARTSARVRTLPMMSRDFWIR